MLIHLIQGHNVAFTRTKALHMMAIITQGIAMPNQPEWEARVKGLLKAELKRRNVTYKDLTVRLEAMGVHDTEPNIRNKLARGKFTAVFFIQCLEAVGCQTLRISEE